jgi:Sugar diacid utilization regulator
MAASPHQLTAAQVEAERATLQKSFDLQLRLTGVVARGGSVDDLLAAWQRDPGEAAAVFDRVGRVIGRSAEMSASAIETVAAALEQNPPRLGDRRRITVDDESGLTVEIAPFAGRTTVRGYLIRTVSEQQVAELAFPALLSLLALEFERRWYLDEPARRRGSQNVARLLSAEDEGQARALLQSLGVESRTVWGVAIEADSDTRAEVLVEDLAVVLATPLIRQSGRIVECIALERPTAALQHRGLGVPVGIGMGVSPGKAARSILQATWALATSRRTRAAAEFVDGASHEFLLNVADPDYLNAFADAVLAPIEEFPNGEALLGTLHTWLSERRSIEATAERMHVHRHTVHNRIQRINQLIGRSLETVDAQTELWLALKIRGYRQE